MWPCSKHSALHDRQGQRYCHDCHAAYQRDWRRNVQVSVTLDHQLIHDAAGMIQDCTEIGKDTAHWLAANLIALTLDRLGIHHEPISIRFPSPIEPSQSSPHSYPQQDDPGDCSAS
jgi:hypothetical protein